MEAVRSYEHNTTEKDYGEVKLPITFEKIFFKVLFSRKVYLPSLLILLSLVPTILEAAGG